MFQGFGGKGKKTQVDNGPFVQQRVIFVWLNHHLKSNLKISKYSSGEISYVFMGPKDDLKGDTHLFVQKSEYSSPKW